MGVYQPWYEHMIRPLQVDAGFVCLSCLSGWQQIDNTAIGDGDCMIGQYPFVGLDRDAPASRNQCVARLHFVSFDPGREGLGAAQYNGAISTVQKSY